jgi:molybdate transport system substrate-binding protein
MASASTRRPVARRVWAPIGVVLLVALLAPACGDTGTGGGAGKPANDGSPVEIVVSAASDLSPVLEELLPLFEAESGIVVKTNLGSTGQLAEQILAGAKVDVFLAASSSAVDQLAEKGLLVPDSARVYARGRLVLWTPVGGAVTAASVQDLTSP